MTEPAYVICMPFTQCRVQGSEKVVCCRCEAVCGISPATKARVQQEGEYRIICGDCFMKERKGDEEFQPFTKGQIKEFLEGI